MISAVNSIRGTDVFMYNYSHWKIRKQCLYFHTKLASIYIECSRLLLRCYGLPTSPQDPVKFDLSHSDLKVLVACGLAPGNKPVTNHVTLCWALYISVGKFADAPHICGADQSLQGCACRRVFCKGYFEGRLHLGWCFCDDVRRGTLWRYDCLGFLGVRKEGGWVDWRHQNPLNGRGWR